MKAEVIRDVGGPVVYTDVDARFRSRPIALDELDCDFAAHWRNGQELLSGTLYIGGGAAAAELVDLWILENESNPNRWDQKNLQAVLGREPSRWRTVDLPSAYCKIFDTMHGEPVIEHFQASRRLRKVVNARHHP